jgi:hypothetical protein
MLSRAGALLRAGSPLSFWRHPKRTLRRWIMVRRGWPTPADLDEMSASEIDAYVRHIGFDDRIKSAVANSDASAETEADSRVRVG